MTKYFIGTSGWSYEHWIGSFYPKNLPKTNWLDFYTKTFETVEVNYSFYHWPSEKTMERWHSTVPKAFKFTLKAPRTITHIKKLLNVKKDVGRFINLMSILKKNFGCCLYQLPPQVKCTPANTKKLEHFLSLLDYKKKNVIEFRHKSWWNEKVYNLLEKYKAIFCVVSGLGMPTDIVKTSNVFYFRFHGNRYMTRYTKRELKKYAASIKDLKCKEVYAYFNNDAFAFAVKNAITLKELLT